ncbi:DUF1559 family PulG-like putative transporter [Roseimaritima ulvae]|uniref:DUF1559 domain-containing protein n=1 Tax=Roseimaritima ulvae TaxID=980254 RepID=A0A5B9QZK8_9BACT|nr:DUF1559 domain-containing protein [Roseimaritima ulvae]QEG42616.1 hypothetical protein UC8_46580 [Roseimaritima ulvae]
MTLPNRSAGGTTVLTMLALVSLLTCPSQPLRAQDPAEQPQPAEWSLDEALEQLQLYPRDAYLQYAVLQMARGTDRFQEVSRQVERIARPANLSRRPGQQATNAFGIFSGALAIQESLQLDRLTADTNPQQTSSTQLSNVPITSLTGPTIKSHPWEEMLAGKTPEVSRLSQSVPADFFFVEAASVSKLLELKDVADLWGQHAFTQSTQTARKQLTVDRLLQQLAVDANGPLRAFYDTAVSRIAITGSDLFFRSGTDVSLLFEVKQRVLFRARMELFLQAAAQPYPDAVRSEGTLNGVPYTKLATPDRRVHVLEAELAPNLFVRSNSLAALRRIIEVHQGRNAAGSLGESLEFQYIRTLMETDADDEDVFVYLSDPFIRRLVGPQLKLTVLRRMHCYNHMRMMAHASLLYRTRFGSQPESIAQLVDTGCAPKDFASQRWACPEGGRYTLSDAGVCSCSHHGNAQAMTPCLEIPVEQVTRQEAEAYKVFLDQYNQYWRRFFDPIALQIKVSPEQYRAETIILPLIDNTLYSGLASAFNGEPEHLDAAPVPSRNIFTTSVRLNKMQLARSFGAAHLLPATDQAESELASGSAAAVGGKMRELGIALHNYHDTFASFPPANRPTVHRQLSWRVHLLPFLGENALYEQFHLSEPWDSPHNKTLIDKIPDVYRSGDAALTAAGKTLIMQPTGEGLFRPAGEQPQRFRNILDGLSNTIMLVEASGEHADIWTKPADLKVDLQAPTAKLNIQQPEGFLALFGDGQVRLLRRTTPSASFAALLTINGRERIDDLEANTIRLQLSPRRRPRSRTLAMQEELLRLGLGEFLINGIGNQVSMNLYDGDPLVGFNTLEYMGQTIRGMSRRGGIGDNWLMWTPLIASFNSPVYVSVPVQDQQIVDDFLQNLDTWLASYTRQSDQDTGWFRIKQEFYRWDTAQDVQPRAVSLQFGPITFRFFWARIGDHLHLASKPFILDDLAALQAEQDDAKVSGTDEAAHGHAMLRLRPEHWDQVLPSFHLGWSESHREACLDNLGPLSSVQRALRSGDGNEHEHGDEHGEQQHAMEALAAKVYDTHYFCPAGGRYVPTADGKRVVCTEHGSALAPRQPVRLGEHTALGEFMKEFELLTMTLTFLEDGLHAVVTIDRK